jgi:hypothetical protein
MRALSRRVRFRKATRDYAIAPLASLMRRVEDRSRATGQSLDEAAAIVVEDLERAAAALTARTAPLVPACGVLVAAAGLMLKVEPASDPISEIFFSLTILSTVGALWFLIRAHFVYVGRRHVGLSPTVDDIAFTHRRLVRKHADVHYGGWLAGIGLTCLLLGILLGVRFSLNTG